MKATPAELSQRFGPSPSHIPYGEVRGGGVGAALSIQDWRHLATRTVKSIDKPGLRIKPTNQFENVTHSKRFDGFIFVGNSSVAVNSGKGSLPIVNVFVSAFAYSLTATVPRYKRKKSRNETMQFLERGEESAPHQVPRAKILQRRVETHGIPIGNRWSKNSNLQRKSKRVLGLLCPLFMAVDHHPVGRRTLTQTIQVSTIANLS